MIDELKKEYSSRIEKYSHQVKRHQKMLNSISILRLTLFVFCVLFLFQAFPIHAWISYLAAAFSLIVFLKLVKEYQKSLILKKYFETKVLLNENEIQALNENYSVFENGSEYINPSHQYGYDMDLFGEGNIFQSLNRTVSKEGSDALAYAFLNIPNKKEEILAEQECIQELEGKLDFRQSFLAHRLKYGAKEVDSNIDFDHWIKSNSRIASGIFYKLMTILIPLCSIAMIVLSVIGKVTLIDFIFYLVFPFAIVGSRLKQINYEYTLLGKLSNQLHAYVDQITLLETESFESAKMKHTLQKIEQSKIQASQILSKLNSILNAMDNRNGIGGFILNGLLVWDIIYIRRLMRWKNTYGQKLDIWINELAEIEKDISLSNFAYNNNHYVYPKISDEEVIIAEDIGHPMIPNKKRINNQYVISKSQKIDVITGANMAGKSTFLRTIGINLILGHLGTKICANKFSFYPISLISSMRTTDSLKDEESFFFSELKRLQLIIQMAEQGEKLFIILDEILKGTNSDDKQNGSFKFVEKLSQHNVKGIIATHDLRLCELEKLYPNKIRNFAFEVEIENNNMAFDYILQPGICRNMNASFLMRKMGIIDD